MSDETPALTPQQQAQQRARAQRDLDLREVLNSSAGRRLFWRILNDDCNVFGGSYTGEATSTTFNEGQRAVGLRLMSEAQAVTPSAYVAMVTEAVEAQRTAALEAKLAEGKNGARDA